MVKSLMVAALAAALCFSFLLSPANATSLDIVGKAYCDTCRVEFETSLSEPLEGATVRLECRFRANSTLTFSTEGVTNKQGNYKLVVEGDHEEEICEVKLVKSPRADCLEPFGSVSSARVLITGNSGVVQPGRFANALGFKKNVALSGCIKVLQGLGFLPLPSLLN